ncbi:MAG: DUF3141 domain-containing protein [Alphaproteobacteria bacterium]|nr:DUF3141 domain-containing protein [Alphaproteobacteria bacterium]
MTALPWQQFWDYSVDFWQRNALFLDVMRQRGDNYLEHMARPVQEVLHFDYTLVLKGTDRERPVNYGLVRIHPPKGVKIDDQKRPYVVVDPRAGHGPGIGGFKPESQIGAILEAGHPCYFIGFITDPIPGQTIEDVGRAEVDFLRHVAEQHPEEAGKPCVIGNCQAGWAMMMLAATAPNLVGPLLIAGAPISYWAGERGKNPMRYLGGLLGGTWMTALLGDLGKGIFDGANLVGNFEGLNPAHTYWSKQYNLWSKVDTEAERYLEFERWWGAHTLLNAEEMQFIADELFVGNKLIQGDLSLSDGTKVDLRNIRSPIVVFCSHGDNITPPQQALHWILDLYDDVDEIRSHGQTIVYSLHDTVGHLGIFVSGKVGAKEHDQFTRNMDMIDILPPGLYEVHFNPKTDTDKNPDLAHGDYIVTVETRTLDDIRALGELDEGDEETFATVARVSEINTGLYKTLVSPIVKRTVTDQSAELMRELHPARLQYALPSSSNPFMAWTQYWADLAKSQRQPVSEDNPYKVAEGMMSDAIVTGLNMYQEMRDTLQERTFFNLYESPVLKAMVGLGGRDNVVRKLVDKKDPARLAYVREKKAALKEDIAVGGPREATIRSLIYVGLPEGRADERAFGALRQVREQVAPDKRLTLPEFKELVRRQYLKLIIAEDEAMESLDAMLPSDKAEREKLYQLVVSLTTAARAPSDLRKKRMEKLAGYFGVSPSLADDPTDAPKLPKSVSRARRKTPAASKSGARPRAKSA